MDAYEAWRELDPSAPPRLIWIRGVPGPRVVLLLGAFDPPTVAHVAVARAAAEMVGAPAAFCPTRVLLGRPAEALLADPDRLRLLDAVAEAEGMGLAAANRGTYLEVARAARAAGADPFFVVGSDKLPQLAEASFYEDGEAGVRATFDEVRFLVVPRGVAVDRADVQVVRADPALVAVSATEVRRLVRAGLDVAALVPDLVGLALKGYTEPSDQG
jgi:nicotinic acid mononucleotide adenylyltransferase